MVCVFARKTSEPLASLVKQIDQKIGENDKLKGFVVILSDKETVPDDLRKLARTAGITVETRIARGSDVYRKIINTATEEGCDLICMASHGRRGISGPPWWRSVPRERFISVAPGAFPTSRSRRSPISTPCARRRWPPSSGPSNDGTS